MMSFDKKKGNTQAGHDSSFDGGEKKRHPRDAPSPLLLLSHRPCDLVHAMRAAATALARVGARALAERAASGAGASAAVASRGAAWRGAWNQVCVAWR